MIIPAAFVLDLLLGDPKGLPHPIRWMGIAIEKAEPVFRKNFSSPLKAGALFAVSLILAALAAAYLFLAAMDMIHPIMGWVSRVVLIWYCISAASLKKAAMDVYLPLGMGDLETARKNVSMIVGRQTDKLDETGIARAAVETVAENFVDGFVSPLFFAAIGGAPLAVAYKMINTLDSMVGYRNDAYLYFGRAAARIDDVANYIPARLSVPVIALASSYLRKRGKMAFMTALRQGRKHKSPNAGYPEAAFAGALGVTLGGPNFYHGKLVDKPYIGKEFEPVTIIKIKQACDLMITSSVLYVLLLWAERIVVA